MISELYASILKTITMWQYQLNMEVSSAIRDYSSEGSWYAIGTVLLIAFAYGLIHAAGPGHGKALVGAYFINNRGSYAKALKIGYLIAVIHSLSALILTFSVYFLIEGIFSRTFHDVSHIGMKISSILVIIIGFYLIYEAYKDRNMQEQAGTTAKSDFAVALSAGIVPCPGVMTISLFSISMGFYILGIASAIVMSIGMGLTISLAGILSVRLSRSGASLISKYGYLLQYFGALLVIILGLFLAIVAFSAH
jgi:nickel/cobalt exporter